MAVTFYKIATVTVGSGGASTIEFTSIPQTYTDLQIALSARGTSTALYARAEINGNAGTNYSLKTIYGEGSGGTASQNDANTTYFDRFLMNSSAYTANTFSNAIMYIPNYTSSNKKCLMFDSVDETNATAAPMYMVAGVWNQTSAITSIKFTPNTGNFAQYSSATLYGISNS